MTASAEHRCACQVDKDESAAAALVALMVAMGWLGLAAARGALGIPRNDDWVYYRAAFAMARSGHLEPDRWTSTLLLGQLEIARPVVAVFGESRTALQVLVMLLGAIGLWATWHVVRSSLPIGWAGVVVASLALGPLFASLSASFMTDIPSFAFTAVSLWAAVGAVREGVVRWRWLGALALAFVAFSIREYAVAVPMAMAVLLLARRRRGGCVGASTAFASIALWFAMAGALYRWRSALTPGASTDIDPSLGLPQLHSVAQTVFSMAIYVLPVAPLGLLFVRSAMAPRRRLVMTGTALLLGALFIWAPQGSTPLLRGYLDDSPSYALTMLGNAPKTLPLPVWLAVLAAAACSALAVLVIVVATAGGGPANVKGPWRAGHVLMAAFVATHLATVVAVSVATQSFITDRYLLPALPFAAAVVVGVTRRRVIVTRRSTGAVVVALTGWCLLGLPDGHDGRQRWSALAAGSRGREHGSCASDQRHRLRVVWQLSATCELLPDHRGDRSRFLGEPLPWQPRVCCRAVCRIRPTPGIAHLPGVYPPCHRSKARRRGVRTQRGMQKDPGHSPELSTMASRRYASSAVAELVASNRPTT